MSRKHPEPNSSLSPDSSGTEYSWAICVPQGETVRTLPKVRAGLRESYKRLSACTPFDYHNHYYTLAHTSSLVQIIHDGRCKEGC
ncbi:hypothetical protein CY34DRAFT_805671 [Suillus luteus UH-Slu-Lm8-n1]|uniref:Uncharacterized protein n=1 Tax=Suillus luteus UH-Slu-Lm8-n1 TaxID=930992 RepID=A0A0D0B5N4_9AGAM|nr:hypothetical protein CY34DRAFT_805671 [Suillus luteus UH-Slu-Lm8-n1]